MVVDDENGCWRGAFFWEELAALLQEVIWDESNGLEGKKEKEIIDLVDVGRYIFWKEGVGNFVQRTCVLRILIRYSIIIKLAFTCTYDHRTLTNSLVRFMRFPYYANFFRSVILATSCSLHDELEVARLENIAAFSRPSDPMKFALDFQQEPRSLSWLAPLT